MSRLNTKMLEDAKRAWGLSEELQFVRKVANDIYYAPASKAYFRMTDLRHREVDQVEAELDWMFFLQSKGVEFAHPIKSQQQNYYEVFESEERQYIVAVFQEARGRRIIEKEGFTKEVLRNWGEVIGRMHQVTKSYVPSGVKKRPEWNEEKYHNDIITLTEHSHGKIFHEFKRLESLFLTLPKDRDSYGLIHADLHDGNFHVDQAGQIMSFDFDDCI